MLSLVPMVIVEYITRPDYQKGAMGGSLAVVTRNEDIRIRFFLIDLSSTYMMDYNALLGQFLESLGIIQGSEEMVAKLM